MPSGGISSGPRTRCRARTTDPPGIGTSRRATGWREIQKSVWNFANNNNLTTLFLQLFLQHESAAVLVQAHSGRRDQRLQQQPGVRQPILDLLISGPTGATTATISTTAAEAAAPREDAASVQAEAASQGQNDTMYP